MDKTKFTKTAQKFIDTLKKYKYAALVLLIGLALLLFPFGENKEPAPEVSVEKKESTADYAVEMERKLTQILMQIDGAGRVSVMLTLQTGPRTEYQIDIQTSDADDTNGRQKTEERKTVILSKGSAYDEAAVSATIYPQFQGALVVSEGAGNAAVKLNLVNAVAALTGLGTDKITVVKMK